MSEAPRSTVGTTSWPPHVELLVDYTNSVDREEQTDDLTTPRELSGWLVEHELLGPSMTATPDDLALARGLRDALRQAMRAHHDGTQDAAALHALGPEFPLVVEASSEQPGLRPAQDGVRGALSRLLVAVNAAVADDSWRRIKICHSDDCQWAFFDASKNRSRTWCEWGCGNREKTRNYRARKKAAGHTDNPHPDSPLPDNPLPDNPLPDNPLPGSKNIRPRVPK